MEGGDGEQWVRSKEPYPGSNDRRGGTPNVGGSREFSVGHLVGSHSVR